MSLVTKSRAVRGEFGDVTVTSSEDGEFVVVGWYCGDTRTFNLKQLARVIKDLDMLREFPDAWLAVKPANDYRTLEVRLDDADQLHVLADEDRWVDWAELRTAIKKTLKDQRKE